MGNEMSQDGEGGMVPPGHPGQPGMMPSQRPSTMAAPRPNQYQMHGGPRPPGPGPVRFQGPQSHPYMAPSLASTMPQQSVSRSPSQGMQMKVSAAPPPRSASGPIPAVGPAGPPDIDLSNLSKEERDIIASVMARAQGMTEEPEPPPNEPANNRALSHEDGTNVAKDQSTKRNHRMEPSQAMPETQQEDRIQQQQVLKTNPQTNLQQYGSKKPQSNKIVNRNQHEIGRMQQQHHHSSANQSTDTIDVATTAISNASKCTSCHSKIVRNEVDQFCQQCQQLVCSQCSATHNINKNQVFLCNNCFEEFESCVAQNVNFQSNKVSKIEVQNSSKKEKNMEYSKHEPGEESKIVVPPGKSKTLSQNNHTDRTDIVDHMGTVNDTDQSGFDSDEVTTVSNARKSNMKTCKDLDDRYDILDDDSYSLEDEYASQEEDDNGEELEEEIMMEHIIKEDIEEEEDEGNISHQILQPLPYYDHSPGEVYTIPEEEGESINEYDSDVTSDTVTSLRRWKGMDEVYEKYSKSKVKKVADVTKKEGEDNRELTLTTNKINQAEKMGLVPADRPGNLDLLIRQMGTIDASKTKKEVESSHKAQGQQIRQHAQIHQQINKGNSQNSERSKTLDPKSMSVAADDASSPEFASTGAGMAISNLLATQEKQMQSKGAMQGNSISGVQGNKSKAKQVEQQGKQKGKPQRPSPAEQDWSPITDLSPIMDVSPSVEQAEQELIEHYKEKKMQSQPNTNAVRASTGTISGMLADFSKALGLGKGPSPGPSPEDDSVKVAAPQPPSIANSEPQQKSNSNKGNNIATKGVVAPSGGDLDGGNKVANSEKRSIAEQQQQQQQQHSLSTSPQQTYQQAEKNQKSFSKQSDGKEEHEKHSSLSDQGNNKQSTSSKKVHRKLPQPTVEQMQAALASSANSRHKSSPAKAVAVISASGPVTSTVSMNTPSSATSVTGRRTVEGRTPVPQMGTNVMRVEAMQHNPNNYGHRVSSVSEPGISVGKSPPYSTVTSSMAGPNSSTQNPRLSAVSPYRIIENTIPRLRPEGKQVSPNSSPDDLLLKSGYYDSRRTPTSSHYQGNLSTSILGVSSLNSKEKADSDTQSETDSCKSGKIRRRLPPIPQDQSPSPIPTRKARAKSLSSTSRQSYSQGGHAMMRQISNEETSMNSMYNHQPGLTRPSASDTNLQKLGLDSSEDMYLKELVDFQSNHMKGVGHNKILSGSDSNIYGMQFPDYVSSLRDQFKDELKAATEARRKFLEGVEDLDPNSKLAPGQNMQISGARSPQTRHRRNNSDPKLASFSPIRENKDIEAEISARTRSLQNVPFKSHEYESLSRDCQSLLNHHDYDMKGLSNKVDELELQKVRETSIDSIRDHNILEKTYKSLGLRPYHTVERDSIKNKLLKKSSFDSMSAHYDLWGRDSSMVANTMKKMERKSRKPRSWHPSPYVSEDEDDQMTREEKKATIKAEIARRRIQIEENARLHEQLLRLAKSRNSSDVLAGSSGYHSSSGVVGSSSYYTSPRSYESMSTGSSRSYSYSSLSDKDSSILRSIDELLRKDYGSIYGGRYDRGLQYGGQHGGYYEQMSGQSSSRGSSPSPYLGAGVTAEDLSMQRIASTFAPETDHSMASITEPQFSDFSPMTTDTDTPPDFTPAMPLLPDLPTKSRKLIEDLGSTSIANPEPGPSSGQARTSKSGKVEEAGYDKDARSSNSMRKHNQKDHHHHHHNHHQKLSQQKIVQDIPEEQPFSDHTRRSSGANQRLRQQQQAAQQRKAHAPSVSAQQRYEFPVKKYLLTRDPKDRSVSGNGLGMKVIGGKEVPGSKSGELGAYVAKIYSGGVVDRLGEIKIGDQILEWNGISMINKTYESVQSILSVPTEEVELVIRCDFDMMASTYGYSGRYSDDDQSINRDQKRRNSRLVTAEHHEPRNSTSNHQISSIEHHDSRYPHQYTNALPQDKFDGNRHQNGSNSIPKNSISTPSSLCRKTDSQSIRRVNSSLEHDKIGEPQMNIINNNVSPTHRPSSGSSEKVRERPDSTDGEIQLQVCFDSQAEILYVTIIRAKNLVTNRTDRSLQPPDPFVKCYLLPGRCVENQRRTRYFSRSSNPEWKQTMVYPNVTFESLNQRYFEVTVWNYDIYRPNEFLGEIILDLSDPKIIDEQPRFYKLLPHDEAKRPSHILSSSTSQPTNMTSTQSCESSLSGVSPNGTIGRRMAMLNSRSVSEDSRKNFEKKYKSMGRRKSASLTLSPIAASCQNREKKVPMFPTSNVAAHPLMSQGCHGAVCSIL